MKDVEFYVLNHKVKFTLEPINQEEKQEKQEEEEEKQEEKQENEQI
jgi:hypothetical protein